MNLEIKTVTWVVLWVWALGATWYGFRADQHRRDAWTDLCVIIHRLGLTEDDLRRTLDHGPVKREIDAARKPGVWAHHQRCPTCGKAICCDTYLRWWGETCDEQ